MPCVYCTEEEKTFLLDANGSPTCISSFSQRHVERTKLPHHPPPIGSQRHLNGGFMDADRGGGSLTVTVIPDSVSWLSQTLFHHYPRLQRLIVIPDSNVSSLSQTPTSHHYPRLQRLTVIPDSSVSLLSQTPVSHRYPRLQRLIVIPDSSVSPLSQTPASHSYPRLQRLTVIPDSSVSPLSQTPFHRYPRLRFTVIPDSSVSPLSQTPASLCPDRSLKRSC
ncbi:mucin-12-like isoform X1 [Poecilia formosa]|uniref:mucin-12-like isoform X1 n=1 Tax=Poecilia formosa TaxID=48698 RepID=UPI0007B9B773|nr:PREDICTED: mucin-12-like isoform X1 [Poecilia formosa]